MGKKQKVVLKAQQKASKPQTHQQQKNHVNKTIQIQKVAKLSKKQRKKLKNEMINKNKNSEEKVTKNIKGEKSIQIQEELSNEQVQQEILQNEASPISISSQQLEDNQYVDIELNHRGKQGFEELFNNQIGQAQKKVKSIQIKSNFNSQSASVLYLFHVKKQTFYKAISVNHQKVNQTHLNQTANICIIDESLLKYANQEPSTLFMLNGKMYHKYVQFMKSTVFKIIQNQNPNKKPSNHNQVSKDKKKRLQTNNGEEIKINIQKYIKPSTINQKEQIVEFLRDFEWKEDCLLVSNFDLHIIQTTCPFQNIDPKILASNNSLLILGKKNTGKSTLSEYLQNTYSNSVCVLDCDIGRSLTVSGCVSLITKEQNINIWIGQFTPFNCIENYVRAIEKLYLLYRQKYFSKKLIINTMGYLSGVGEMIIYEIYNLINPSQIIVLTSGPTQQGYDNLSNILHYIKTGNYLNKLLTLSSSEYSENQQKIFNQKRINLNIQYVNNQHAQGKGIPIRFENILTYKQNFKNILELIQSIKNKQFKKIENLTIYQQDKVGNLTKLDSPSSNMRIILIGRWIESTKNEGSHDNSQNSNLFRLFGIGYGFQGAVYFSQQQIENVLSPNINLKSQKQNLIGVLSEGMDFQKNFYLINQLSLIDYELIYGSIPFILPIVKGMGSKGTRNNPSKNV